MMIVENAFCIVRAYAATEQEGFLTVVVVQYGPVKLLYATAYSRTFCIENKGVNSVFVLLVGCKGVAIRDPDSLPNLDTRTQVGINGAAQIADERRLFVTVQLDDVQLEVHHPRDDILCHFIDENAHSLIATRRFSVRDMPT